MTDGADTANESEPRSGVSSSAPPDVARAFTFFFEDPQWIPKLAVGSLFALLSPFLIGAVFLMGYAVGLARRVRTDALPILPEWNGLEEIFLDGLRGLGITLAHKLPLFLLGILTFFAFVGGIFLQRGEGPLPEEFTFVGVPALFGGLLAVFLLSLALLAYLPSALVRFIRTDRFVAAFDVSANLELIRAHPSSYFLGVLAIIIAGLLSQLGFLVFCIGIFPATFWSMCVMGYVVGELAKLDVEGRAGDPTIPKEARS